MLPSCAKNVRVISSIEILTDKSILNIPSVCMIPGIVRDVLLCLFTDEYEVSNYCIIFFNVLQLCIVNIWYWY